MVMVIGRLGGAASRFHKIIYQMPLKPKVKPNHDTGDTAGHNKLRL